MGNTFGNHTTFGFNLNSLNSGKFISEKLNYFCCLTLEAEEKHLVSVLIDDLGVHTLHAVDNYIAFTIKLPPDMFLRHISIYPVWN